MGQSLMRLLLAVVVVSLLPHSVLAVSGLLDDRVSHPPPTTGPLAYNSLVPPLTIGASYVDPAFGATVTRLTTDHAQDDIYARNMWWNADETRYFHQGKIINVVTNRVEYMGLPLSRELCVNAGCNNEGFDPVDPNVYYYHSGSTIRKITLQAGGTWTESVYFTAPSALKDLGSTLNWWDASGRYFLVRYGPEPSVYLYDRQNLAAGPYANPVRGDNSIDQNGYIGISPDGKFLVGWQQVGGQIRPGANVSWAVNHTTRSVAAVPTIFWSLCGDHGSFLSASDGRNYYFSFNCWNGPGVWRADITNQANGLSAAQQEALPNNRRLLALNSWDDGNGHFTTVARGPLKDWGFVSLEDSRDAFNGGTSPWRPYRQEIIGINVVTGEVRRLAHHRSRSIGGDYFSSPRLSASWGGKYVSWASNFNQNGVVDVYAARFSATSTAPIPPQNLRVQ
jgi:hypothetical protein